MPFTIEDAWLPATLTAPPMTDEAFAELVSAHPDLWFEMTSSGELIVIPPTKSKTGARSAKINAQLSFWAEADGRGTESTPLPASFFPMAPDSPRMPPGSPNIASSNSMITIRRTTFISAPILLSN